MFNKNDEFEIFNFVLKLFLKPVICWIDLPIRFKSTIQQAKITPSKML